MRSKISDQQWRRESSSIQAKIWRAPSRDYTPSMTHYPYWHPMQAHFRTRKCKQIIPRNLNTQARIKFVAKGGEKLRDKADIFELYHTIKRVVDLKAKDECKKRQAQNNHQGNNSQSNQSKKGGLNQGVDQGSNKAGLTTCQIYGNHKWSKCPNNNANKDTNTETAKSKSTSKGVVRTL